MKSYESTILQSFLLSCFTTVSSLILGHTICVCLTLQWQAPLLFALLLLVSLPALTCSPLKETSLKIATPIRQALPFHSVSLLLLVQLSKADCMYDQEYQLHSAPLGVNYILSQSLTIAASIPCELVEWAHIFISTVLLRTFHMDCGGSQSLKHFSSPSSCPFRLIFSVFDHILQNCTWSGPFWVTPKWLCIW